MFENLKAWPRIVVGGPQRSGTSIIAKMISHDTRHRLFGEERIRTDSMNRFWNLLRTTRNGVFHCPAMTRWLHLLAKEDRGLLVVMCKRSLDEIKASQERIRWMWEAPELLRYDRTSGSQAEIKYAFWENHQKPALQEQGLEVEYSTIKEHPLWVSPEDRKNFTVRQTE
jgi:hypothetical protein